MKAADLVRDAGTGQLSQTKLWTNIAYTVGTIAFLYPVVKSGTPPDPESLLIYLGVVGSHCAVSKFISMKYRNAGQRADDLGGAAYRDDPRDQP